MFSIKAKFLILYLSIQDIQCDINWGKYQSAQKTKYSSRLYMAWEFKKLSKKLSVNSMLLCGVKDMLLLMESALLSDNGAGVSSAVYPYVLNSFIFKDSLDLLIIYIFMFYKDIWGNNLNFANVLYPYKIIILNSTKLRTDAHER